MTPAQLVEQWRSTAAVLLKFGAEGQGRAIERCAQDLEEALEGGAADVLTLPEASTESGYSRERLAELVREGKIPNAGRKTHGHRLAPH